MSDKPQYTLMHENETLEMTLDDIIRVVELLQEKGLVKNFMAEAKSSGAYAIFDAKSVNFVKEFFAKEKLGDSLIGAHILRAPGARAESLRGGRYRCNFGHG